MLFVRNQFRGVVTVSVFLAICFANRSDCSPTNAVTGLTSSQLLYNGWQMFLRQTEQYINWCKTNKLIGSCFTKDGNLNFASKDCTDYYFEMMGLMKSYVDDSQKLSSIERTLADIGGFCSAFFEDVIPMQISYGPYPTILSNDEWKSYFSANKNYVTWCKRNGQTYSCATKKDEKFDSNTKDCFLAYSMLRIMIMEYNHMELIKQDFETMIADRESFCTPKSSTPKYGRSKITGASSSAPLGINAVLFVLLIFVSGYVR